ncbi:MAG: FimD/PapC C-terminal domain-containing protein, partial [Stenotrophomonas sp.]
ISFLRFDTRKGRAVLIQVRGADGSVLPFGAQAKDARGQPVGMVGQAGRLYMRSELERGHLQLAWGEAEDQQCGIDYQLPAVTDASPMG